MISFHCALRRPQLDFDVAFDSKAGITGLIGPSGSGKSTIIQLIAGLVQPGAGRIVVGDRLLLDTERRLSLPPHRRGTGLVFQDAQLFPHLSVRQNLNYGRGFGRLSSRRVDLDAVVDVLGIAQLLGRSPTTLSGGERQRVAIGRALLASPSILLMDEPLASLDTARKLEILPFIERLRDEFAIPIIYVSHAVEEIARLAGTVIRIDRGRVVAAGAPGDVLSDRATDAARERFDVISTLSGEFLRYEPEYGVSVLAHPAGEIVIPGRITASAHRVRFAVRATNVAIGLDGHGPISIRTSLRGYVEEVHTTGPFANVWIRLDGGERICACITRLSLVSLGLAGGQPVRALIKAVAIDESGVSGLQAT